MANDNILEEQALVVAAHLAYHEDVGTVAAFDPATIALIIQVLAAIYKLLKDWGYFSVDVPGVMRNPNFIQRWYAKRAIAKVTGQRNFVFKAGQTNEKIYNGINKLAHGLTAHDAGRAYMVVA